MKKIAITFMFLLCAILTYAQKLPKIQHKSVYAPNNIKIDGKATEWNKYQAYNAVNHLFYALANDDKNLYLIVHSSDNLAIQKIVRWGIALTVSSSANKSINNVSVSFPFGDGEKNYFIVRDGITKDDLPSKDALMKLRNSKINDLYKLIQVTGIKEIDSPISVYNTDGIKAAALFDKDLEYTYELELPLKYLNSVITNGTHFNYNIKLNGGVIKNPRAMPVRVDGGTLPDRDYLMSPTDFGGEYTLAKKSE